MAGFHHVLCKIWFFKSILVLLFVVLRAPGVFVTSDKQQDLVIECKDEVVSSWHKDFKDSSVGTKCNITCPYDCSCSLGNYSEVMINCSNGNVSVAHVSYPSNVTRLSWAHGEICSLSKDSFAALANTLEFLHLKNNNLQRFQYALFEGLTNLLFLDLRFNVLEEIVPGAFEGMINLTHLDLSNNILRNIHSGMFLGLRNLLRLYLSSNVLEEIQPGAFTGLGGLSKLNLHNNLLKELQPGVFKELRNLTGLDLFMNLLNKIHPGAFKGLEKLELIYLHNNRLVKLLPDALGELKNLTILFLSNNPLLYLHPKTLNHLTKLDILRLENTSLSVLPKDIFKSLRQLRYLNLSENDLNELEFQLFKDCPVLETLDLIKNPLQWLRKDGFSGLNDTAQVFVDNPASCCFVTKATCHARSPKSPVLTCGRLLTYDILRVGIWIVSILAIVNNVVGILLNCKHRKQVNKVRFLLITNLSISDLLMGVYLIILLSVDLYFTDHFPSHSESWRNSALCKIAGSLSVLSSEASVFFITLISIDRFLRVKFPYGRYWLNNKSASVVLSLLWLLALGISITSFVLSGMDADVYSVSEICVGLPISRQNSYITNETTVQLLDSIGVTIPGLTYKTRDSQVSMYFSIAIFTVLNLWCFLVVGFCYTAIFTLIWKSAKKSGLSISRNEIHMAKKVFLLVLTDLCCWVPIGVLSILVQAGAVEVNPVAYAWIATFILPINSSINPFLYTLGDVIADKVTCSCKLTRRKHQDTCEYIEAREIARSK